MRLPAALVVWAEAPDESNNLALVTFGEFSSKSRARAEHRVLNTEYRVPSNHHLETA